ncbi:anti-sigma factor [Actinoalloteichus caeruleus]|uniref:anti-sigma factor n=1 Tax=Actinoalloteichus cyanogriseus TaxID=2893586 RepID=UPI003AAF44DE
MSAQSPTQQNGNAALAPHSVEVRVAALPHQLPVLRGIAGDIAMREDFDLDSIEDLRLAVDEVCSTLIRLAVPDATLVCRYDVAESALRVVASVVSASSTGPRTDTFGWRVLTTLTSSIDSTVETRDDGLSVVQVELVKQRGTAVAE